MARQGKILPARRPRSGEDDSLLIRSAESLGRMIGSLQRQLDGASRKLSAASFAPPGVNGHEADARTDRAVKTTTKNARPKAKTAKGGGKSGATKVNSVADRKSKRASKSATAKKSAGRSRSGASRKAAKTAR